MDAGDLRVKRGPRQPCSRSGESWYRQGKGEEEGLAGLGGEGDHPTPWPCALQCGHGCSGQVSWGQDRTV